jgi:plasmid stabilization system protein ParE
MKVRISGKARAELLDIYAYFAARNPAAAERTLQDINAKLRQLSHFPFMGREPNLLQTFEARWSEHISSFTL